jgi:hypothetical protein
VPECAFAEPYQAEDRLPSEGPSQGAGHPVCVSTDCQGGRHRTVALKADAPAVHFGHTAVIGEAKNLVLTS